MNKKKARLDAFRGPGHRLPLEDLVTSSIFGPLLFLDQEEAAAALSLIFSALEISPPAWIGPAHLSLWPKHKTLQRLRSNYIEPDVEIADTSGNALIIEVKWGAWLSENELASQWLALKQAHRATSKHLLIVLEPHSHYQKAIALDRAEIAKTCDLPWPIGMVTWRRMADALRVVGADVRLNPGTRRWALGAHAFLRREDPRALGGWNGLDLVQVGQDNWRYGRRLINYPSGLRQATWQYNEEWFKPQSALQPVHWRFRK